MLMLDVYRYPEFIWDTVAVNGDAGSSQLIVDEVTFNFKPPSPEFIWATVATNGDTGISQRVFNEVTQILNLEALYFSGSPWPLTVTLNLATSFDN
jgi:hypothetical protein